MSTRTFSIVLLMVVLTILAMSGCVQPAANNSIPATKKIKIGFAMSTLKEERWVRDKDAFEKRCAELGVDCIIKVANNSSSQQANDVENFLTQNVDVLVIVPNDATEAISMVEKAKAQGVPVVSYDRLINSDKIDVYISHQVPIIGRKIAEYALAKIPKGNYVLVYGDGGDNNAMILKKEMLSVLDAAIKKGDINIVADQHATGWKREEAQKIVENALTKQGDKIDAIVASNDGTAGGAIAALEPKGLVGKILVTGQDAQKDALQSVAEGKQTMTVYKPIIPLANAAVEAAIKLAKKEPLTEARPFMNDNIKKEVPAILLEVQVVDQDNLMTTVIKDGFAAFDDVYKNVPADKRPKQP